MSSETNKSSDTGSGKTINIFGGQIGALKNQDQISHSNSVPPMPQEIPDSNTHTNGSNNHVAPRDYQEMLASASDDVSKQLHSLLTQIKHAADDFADIEAIVSAADDAVQEATAAHPDLKRIASHTETLKQAAENRLGIAAPIARMALAMVRLLELNF